MVVPNNHGRFPTKNDQHLGCEMGVPPCKETPIWLEALSVIDEVEILVEHLLGRIIVHQNCLPSWFRGGSWIARILSS